MIRACVWLASRGPNTALELELFLVARHQGEARAAKLKQRMLVV